MFNDGVCSPSLMTDVVTVHKIKIRLCARSVEVELHTL
jgi:hypothetical protein